MGIWNELRVCSWPTASLPATALVPVERAAEAHDGGRLLLRTCQRVEVYHREQCDCAAPEQHDGLAALTHLAEVAAGLHSVVLGEREVLGQVRAAVAAATGHVRGCAGLAVAAARQLRREQLLDGDSGRLLDSALAAAGAPATGTLLVLGTGRMARLVASRGLGLGFGRVVVAGRTPPGPTWADHDQVEFVRLDAMRAAGAADVVAGCLGAGADEIDAAALPPVRRLLIDLATPRNFTGAPGVPLITIAGLIGPCEGASGGALRRRLRERLGEIVASRAEAQRADSGSQVGAFRLAIEELRRGEIERIQRLHPEIPLPTIETITRSLVNRIFHGPSVRLAKADPAVANQFVTLFQPTAHRE